MKISKGNLKNRVLFNHLLYFSILLSVDIFIASCKKDTDYAPRYSGNYNFSTIEISQTGIYCEDTIQYVGTISANGKNKLKIVFKAPYSSTCDTQFDNGIIDSEVDENGNLTNSNNTPNHSGTIQINGKINLKSGNHYGQGGYYGTILTGIKF